MQSFTFSMPVKTYIQKYYFSRFGDTIPLSMDTVIGSVVLNFLASRLEAKVNRGMLDLFEQRYDAKLTFIIPWHYFSLTKKEVSKFTCLLLNRYFETEFEEALCKHVDHATRCGVRRYRAIEQFTEKYGIDLEVDISSEALKKMEYRYRKKNIEKLSRGLSAENNLFSRQAV